MIAQQKLKFKYSGLVKPTRIYVWIDRLWTCFIRQDINSNCPKNPENKKQKYVSEKIVSLLKNYQEHSNQFCMGIKTNVLYVDRGLGPNNV